MLQKVMTYCEQHKLLAKQDTVIVGISGGADSVCLLSILKKLQMQYDLRLEAVHVNHLLRGEAAEGDAVFTKRLCENLNVPCTVYAYPVETLAKEQGLSLEEAGRRARYALLLEHANAILNEESPDSRRQKEKDSAKRSGAGTVKIAAAHQMDDQAETVLMHLVRGSGLKGLSGMQPMRSLKTDSLHTEILRLYEQHENLSKQTSASNTSAEAQLTSKAALPRQKAAEDERRSRQTVCAELLIRPLLCVTREEIEGYLASEGLPFREDASNAEDAYTRNKIRHHVLSYIKEEIAPGAVEAMCRSAKLVSQAEDYLSKTAARCLEAGAKLEETQVCVDLPCFQAQHAAIQGCMARQCIAHIGALKDVTQQHIDSICALACGQTGKELALPGGIYVYRDYKTLIFSKNARKQKYGGAVTDGGRQAAWPAQTDCPTQAPVPDIAVEIPGVYHVKETGETFVFTKKTYRKEKIFPNSAYTKWFDYDKINCQLRLRGRRAGDYLQVNAAGGTKKLKKYLIDCKCPANMRDRLLLLADGSHILWIPGYRISEAYKITEQTKTVLIVTRTQGEDT